MTLYVCERLWDKFFPFVKCTHRMSVHKLTGHSSIPLMVGEECSVLADMCMAELRLAQLQDKTMHLYTIWVWDFYFFIECFNDHLSAHSHLAKLGR